MSRSGAGVYTLPPGSTIANGDTSDASDLNTPFADLEIDANTPRPVVAGGTGAATAGAALTNLGGTTTGKAVFTAVDAPAARTAISAQASNAALTSVSALGTAGTVLAMNDAATGVVYRSLTEWQTPQAATSGTAFDFTGIPAWATEIIISFQNISFSGTDHILVQAGTSAGIFGGAYSVSGSIDGATAASVSSSAGFVIYHGTAADGLVGEMRLVRPDSSSNSWLSKHNCARGPAKISTGAGIVGLPGVLDRVRITRTGTNTFDGASGSVNVGWR